MELPFIFVGCIVVGGAIGYFLDAWLHSQASHDDRLRRHRVQSPAPRHSPPHRQGLTST